MIALLKRLARPITRGPSPARRDDLRVTVYTRAECCCCHTAIDVLESYRRRHGLVIELVDVDGDPALADTYGPSVPVVAIDGKVRFRGVVNPVLLDRLIAARG